MANNGWGGQRVARARAQWAPYVQAGAVVCHLCHRPIRPGQAWDLDHAHALALGGDLDGPVHPAHRSCNRAHGARIGNRLRARRARRARQQAGDLDQP